jgi:Ca2+-binding RTX toxin-like protein
MTNIIGTENNDTLIGTPLNDDILGLGGDDTLDGLAGQDNLDGGAGDDILTGGDDGDSLLGGNGNDDIAGEKGNDVMLGGAGDDLLDWDDGEGSDLISGGEGSDTVEVNGAVAKSDQFTLKQEGSTAIFDRINLGKFTLTVDTVESFEIFGEGGDDLLIVSDLSATDVKTVKFFGSLGNETLDGSGTTTPLEADGAEGDDVLISGKGVDTLTGGSGGDFFTYVGDPFAAGAPVLAGMTGIKALNKPDKITDYEIGRDRFVFDAEDFDLDSIAFQKNKSTDLIPGSNALVLLNPFPAAAAAAKAIADNPNVTADAGVFVYFNTTLGISRLVYSKDLGDGGDISVLANLTNQAGDVGIANLANFSASDFIIS